MHLYTSEERSMRVDDTITRDNRDLFYAITYAGSGLARPGRILIGDSVIGDAFC